MDRLLGELRYAWRQVARSPGFALLAVVMLGLGIGATTTIFSVINALFLRPPPAVRQPERLVAIFTSDFSGPDFGTSSHSDYVDYAAGAGALSAIAATSPRPFSVAAGRARFRTLGEMVSDNYFEVLGVPLAAGSGFASGASETQAVISHGLWKRVFGGDRGVIGRTLRLSGRTFTISGVAPAGFTGSIRGVRMEVWTSLAAGRVLDPTDDMLEQRGDRGLSLVGRLRDGATVEQARGQLGVVAARLHLVASLDPEVPVSEIHELRQLRDASISTDRFRTLLLSAFGALALGLAVIGVYGVISYGVVQRTREIGIRVALGARRPEILRLVIGEGLVTVAGGIAVGLVAGAGLSRVLVTLLHQVKPWDPATFASIAVAIAGVALGACVLPARRVLRVDPATTLRAE